MDCPRCDRRMSENDVTTVLTEYVCPACHATEIEWKPAARGRSKATLLR